MELLIVSGMSGSGKSRALNALEDIGYYCIDNLPPRFFVNFTDFLLKDNQTINKVAVNIDVRSNEFFLEFNDVINEIKKKNLIVKTLFLDCDDNIIMHRYKETRRNHPLMAPYNISLKEAIQKERLMLNKIKPQFDYVVDTSYFSTSQLREKIVEIFSSSKTEAMFVNFVSFGFKYGQLLDGDIIFDVRCMPNPFYEEELKNLTGEDEPVRNFVMKSDEAKEVFARIVNYLEYTIPLYEKEGKSQLVVGLGCTGGKHRSVTFTHLLSKYFEEKGYRIVCTHRDILKK